MRVISGTARGLRLESLDGLDTRPTLDNVKEAIFSMLFDRVYEAQVLDLFSGSGALGIEALSRGATGCVFSDFSDKAIGIIRKNVEKARLTDKSTVVRSDFKMCLTSLGEQGKSFDIIFLDPPYAKGFLDEALVLIQEKGLLNPEGVVVAEYDNGTDVDIQGYNQLKSKRYGRVCIDILEAK